jgi:hypothetical protein
MSLRIGELLVKNRVVLKTQVQKALEIQKKNRVRLGEILIKLGYTNSRQLIRMISQQMDIPFVELRSDIVDPNIIRSFPIRFLYKNNVIPLYAIGDIIYVAVGDPTNQGIINGIKTFTDKEVVLFGAEPMQIARTLDKFFQIDYRPYGYGVRPETFDI